MSSLKYVVVVFLFVVVLGFVLKQQTPTSSSSTRSQSTQAVEAVEERLPEPWISQPHHRWPQMVLTNDAQFSGGREIYGASGFLFEDEAGRIYAGTAKHLLGDAMGIEPAVKPSRLDSDLRSWVMHPRTKPDKSVTMRGIGASDLDDPDHDWLVLRIEPTDQLPAQPIKLRSSPVQLGETVYLLGCPYSESGCTQNVYSGKVENRIGSWFRFAIKPAVDIRGFSGAPIVDRNGHLVGMMTGGYGLKQVGDEFLEAGGEDATVIAGLLLNP